MGDKLRLIDSTRDAVTAISMVNSSEHKLLNAFDRPISSFFHAFES